MDAYHRDNLDEEICSLEANPSRVHGFDGLFSA